MKPRHNESNKTCVLSVSPRCLSLLLSSLCLRPEVSAVGERKVQKDCAFLSRLSCTVHETTSGSVFSDLKNVTLRSCYRELGSSSVLGLAPK